MSLELSSRKIRIDPQTSQRTKVGCGAQVVRADGAVIDPTALDAVESLDDTMFAALAGEATALDEARDQWRSICHFVSDALVSEARAKYIERAETTWGEYRDGINTDVVRAFAALDVLLMLETVE